MIEDFINDLLISLINIDGHDLYEFNREYFVDDAIRDTINSYEEYDNVDIDDVIDDVWNSNKVQKELDRIEREFDNYHC